MWTKARRSVATGLVAATLTAGTLALPSTASAHDRFGSGFALGAVGGAIGGALLSDALHHDRAYPAYAEPLYGPPPVYVTGPYYPACHVVWKRDNWGDMYRQRVCD